MPTPPFRSAAATCPYGSSLISLPSLCVFCYNVQAALPPPFPYRVFTADVPLLSLSGLYWPVAKTLKLMFKILKLISMNTSIWFCAPAWSIDNFGLKSLVDEGSYGRVYFVVLEDGKQIAVKKLDSSSEDNTSEFLTQHENFVEMLGYCVDGNMCLMIYEFATMGSLHNVLHGA
ncbi:hypothetical protein ZIOFF_012322 [Zingiber officinale]|uniref:Protein kinase domain-containing protein n=1 Tax=Zingiber officinale TaxID=94328 RepID=A0A8J5LLE8_ZINOF|nr:hypothetical protein ZIOFF_012322 [Zingiber officinale]